MLYITKIDNYLKIVTVDKVKDFVHISEHFKSTSGKLYSKLSEKQNIREVSESRYIFLTTPNEIGKYAKMMKSNSSNSCVHHYKNEILILFDPEL